MVYVSPEKWTIFQPNTQDDISLLCILVQKAWQFRICTDRTNLAQKGYRWWIHEQIKSTCISIKFNTKWQATTEKSPLTACSCEEFGRLESHIQESKIFSSANKAPPWSNIQRPYIAPHFKLLLDVYCKLFSHFHNPARKTRCVCHTFLGLLCLIRTDRLFNEEAALFAWSIHLETNTSTPSLQFNSIMVCIGSALSGTGFSIHEIV